MALFLVAAEMPFDSSTQNHVTTCASEHPEMKHPHKD
jgi:hypothetical protein